MDDMRFSDMKKKPTPGGTKSGKEAYRHSDGLVQSDSHSSGSRDIFSDSSKKRPSVRDDIPSYPGDGNETPAPVKRTPTGKDVSLSGLDSSPRQTPSGRPISTQPSVRGQQRPSSPTTRPSQRPVPGRTPQQRPTASSTAGRKSPSPAHAKAKPKKKKPVGLIIFGAIMGILLIFTCVIFGYGYSALSGLSYTEIEDKNQYIDESTLVSDSDVRNILFIGSDARDGLSGKRSDSMILFSIDKKHKKLKLTSFMRDSYVYIPSKQYKTRLNAAYSFGGEQLLIDTLEYNFKVKIDDFVMVDYTVFEDFINLLGGLTIEDVTEAEAEYMRVEVNRPKFKAGTNHVDGRTALWYCRIRYLDNDFRRTERQRKVITSIIKTAAQRNIFELIDIVEQVLPNISTNLTKNDLISLAMGAVVQYMHYDIVQQQIPADKTWSDQRINGQAVLVIDLEENQAVLKEFIYGEDTEK